MAGEFPPLPELPAQPWLRTVQGESRKKYDESRLVAIDSWSTRITEIMAGLPGFDGIPTEAKEYLAQRLGSGMVAIFEGGVEAGTRYVLGKDSVDKSLTELASLED